MPILLIVMLLSIAIDQFSKYLVSHHLPYLHAVPVIPGWFSLTYVRNHGAAFSMLQNQRWLLVSVAVGVVLAVMILRNRLPKDWLTQISLGLVVGGTLGNMIDRIRVGSVTDFLDFHVSTIFNIADSALTVGMVFLAWKILFEDDAKKKALTEVEDGQLAETGQAELASATIAADVSPTVSLEAITNTGENISVEQSVTAVNSQVTDAVDLENTASSDH